MTRKRLSNLRKSKGISCYSNIILYSRIACQMMSDITRARKAKTGDEGNIGGEGSWLDPVKE